MEIAIQLTPTDEEEIDIVERFVLRTCGCQRAIEGGACSSQISRETFLAHRAQCAELQKDELDLVILSHIDAHGYDQSKCTEPHVHTERFVAHFYFHAQQICRTTFLFLHGISKHRYENLIKHYTSHGLAVRQHGNLKRLPANTLPEAIVEYIVTFITNFASAHALPLPGRVPGHKDKVMILPSDLPKAAVYARYQQACAGAGIQAVGRSKFYDTWQSLLPHISVSTPSSDLCFVCQQNNLAIQKAVCLSDDEKSARIQVAQMHLDRAKTEREYYNVQIKEAKEQFNDSVKFQSRPIQMHYSFNFAQQVHYPYDAQQTGPEYFKAARKCGIFGVCNDGKNSQVCYLIDEAENPGKGADCVISMIDHYFTVHGCQEKDVKLHADNCVGQNKNNALIHYLLWRTMTGRHRSAELSFMLVGHTKFSPDRFFGLIKKTYRLSTISTINELERVV